MLFQNTLLWRLQFAINTHTLMIVDFDKKVTLTTIIRGHIMFSKFIIILVLFSFIFFLSCSDESTSPNDTQKPTVTILEPAGNTLFEAGIPVIIKAEASDNKGIKQVDFFINGNLEGSDNSEPYEYSWEPNGKNGSFTITAKAYDTSNNIAESDAVTVKIKGPTGTVTDVDGNVYQTRKIGSQWWMAENLKVTHYQDGTAIPEVTDDSEWGTLSSGAMCSYDNDDSNIEIYGRLYNWYAVRTARNIAPAGWHVPTDDEWKELEMHLGMSQSEADKDESWRGTDEGNKLKNTGTTFWESPNSGATNESGFSALPGGSRNALTYNFLELGKYAYFWTSSRGQYTVYSRGLGYSSSTISRYQDWFKSGFSIRCIKD